ncbi:hypothetical protein FGM00_17955 [Aggregatimonas sangjinii]|uniref:Uncharacterized protein n=1 Tax=Aggregatimonas sangjinii TaxID=2583587 RepID=A0A5B7ST02_9FLAO|nr:hypothetical protein [Aggregatimonas sangjinii]QCX01905.1 hypothetical protein FGM00_17955 [Aggregatimonas sangjinii]
MKDIVIAFCLLLSNVVLAQSSSLADMLWAEAGGRPLQMDSDKESRTSITDDAANGYLRIFYEDEGCGCPFDTTVAAYKKANGEFAILKTYWDGCGDQRTFSANIDKAVLLPEDFGLQTFLPNSMKKAYDIDSAVFYLNVELPRNGTDTKIDLKFIPFGLHVEPTDQVLAHSYARNDDENGSNGVYMEEIQDMLRKLSHEETITYILNREPDKIKKEDKGIVKRLYGEGNRYRSIEELSVPIAKLRAIYEIAKDVEYKSVVLGWNRDTARFYIKERIKNNTPEHSFLEFVRQFQFLRAVC